MRPRSFVLAVFVQALSHARGHILANNQRDQRGNRWMAAKDKRSSSSSVPRFVHR